MSQAHAEALQTEFPNLVLGIAPQPGPSGQWRVDIRKEGVLQTLSHAKNAMGFRYLADITAVDYLALPNPPTERFGVIYVMRSLENGHPLVLRAFVSEDRPEIESATPLWKAADWLEREVFDLFGITFLHHPNLIRILMPENFDAHPLRKDFPTEGIGYRDDFPVVTR